MRANQPDIDDIQNELATIRRAITQSRRATARWGDAYVMWGFLIGGALAVQWWGWVSGVAMAWIAWVVATVAGIICSYLLGRRRAKSGEVVSYASRSIKTVWSMVTLAIWMLAFVGIPTHVISQMQIMPLIAMLLGIAGVTTGVTVESTIFKVAGWMWFVGSVISFFVPIAIQFPIFLFLIVVGEIIPGLWLWRLGRRTSDAA